MAERIRTIDEVLIDLDAVAENFDKGWTATPPTMAALVRRIRREIAAGVADLRKSNR